MYRTLVVFSLLSSLALAACQSTGNKDQPAPAPQTVDPGSTVTVTKNFLIPSGDGAVDFQNAGLYPQGMIRADAPFCRFRVSTPTAGGEVIRTGKYTVGNVEYDEKDVGPGGIDVSVTKIHLQGASAGDAYQLDCMLPIVSHGARFVTPEEIQGAIGGYMDLDVAP
jgi:hypothetical protein